MRIFRKNDDQMTWAEIYRRWSEAPREQLRVMLAEEFPHLVVMGATAEVFDQMIDMLTPVLQMRAITGMGPSDWPQEVWDGQHR